MTDAETIAEPTPGEPTVEPLSPEVADLKANKLITNCAWGSAGLGLVPIPLAVTVLWLVVFAGYWKSFAPVFKP